jgi:hypothetical protein
MRGAYYLASALSDAVLGFMERMKLADEVRFKYRQANDGGQACSRKGQCC